MFMGCENLNEIFFKLFNDKRINVWHMSLFIALLYSWYKNDSKDPLMITRREIMKLAHFRSIATYHKCIKQLQEFGYIKYNPSYDPSIKTSIILN